MSGSQILNTKIPVKWSNFWNSQKMFPLLVDPAIDEDCFTFNDNEVTFFTDPPPRKKIATGALSGKGPSGVFLNLLEEF